MTGTCKPGKQEHKSSDPLALEQFLSAFLLLMAGILLAALLLLMEHMYFKYVRKHLAKTDQGGCCALISLSMGNTLQKYKRGNSKNIKKKYSIQKGYISQNHSKFKRISSIHLLSHSPLSRKIDRIFQENR